MSTTRARELRSNMTPAEAALWQHLHRRQVNGHKFHRQATIGPFIVDFACLEMRLGIELDGGQHAGQVSYDLARSEWLESKGFRVLKFWNNRVLSEIDAVTGVILEALEQRAEPPHPNLPPQGGKGQVSR